MTIKGYRSRLAALSANRDFKLLWFGQAGSDLGTSIAALAGPLAAVALTGSTVMAGVAGTVGFTAMWLAYLPGGYLADMFDRRRIMLWCDGLRILLIGSFALALLTGAGSVWWLLVVVGSTSAAGVAFGAAQWQALRQIVAPAQIPEAVSVTQARSYAIELAGPPVGGLLFGLARGLPFLADAVSYLVSWWCVWRIRTPLVPESRPSARRLLPDVGTGWVVLWRNGFLRASTSYSLTTNLTVSMLMYVMIIGGAGDSVLLGLTVGAAAGAGLIGSLLAPLAQRGISLRGLLAGVAGVRGGMLLLAAWTGSRLVFAAALATVVLLGPMTRAAIGAATILAVPGAVLGRAQGSSGFLSGALMPLAPLLSGVLLAALPTSAVLALLAGGFAVVALVALRLPPPHPAPPVPVSDAGSHSPGREAHVVK